MATSSPSDLRDKLHATALYYVHSYDQSVSGSSGNISNLSRALTADCRRFYAPQSIIAALPKLDTEAGQTNAEYEEQESASFARLFAEWKVEVKDVTVDAGARKAVVHSVHHVRTNKGGEYAFEFMWTLWMDGEGARVRRIMEFVDPSVPAKFMEENPGYQ